MKNLLLTTFLILLLPLSGYAYDREKRLSELDKIVRDTRPYEQRMQEQIASLKHQFSKASTDTARFDITCSIYMLYRNFRIDSAMIFANRLIEQAGNLDIERRNKSIMCKADALNKLGEPRECIRLLNTIPRTEATLHSTFLYYLYHSSYLSINESNIDRKQGIEDRKMMLIYTDSIFALQEPGSTGYVSNLAIRLAERGKYREALDSLKAYAKTAGTDESNPESASYNFLMAELYLANGDTVPATDCLIEASISDLTNAKKVYKSLQLLAMLLFRQGDLNRSYRYITKALDDINDGYARYRINDIAEYIPIINSANDRQIRQNRQFQMAFTIVLILLLAVVATAYFLLRRKKRFLAAFNIQLESQNRQLQEMTDSLFRYNNDLRDANKIKVEYIAMLFDFCSESIKRQAELKKSLARKLASNQISEVTKILNRQASESEDFKEFIKRFDAIFISLFPTFVADFNTLLRPEEQIVLKQDELLTPELRIYALIRLGITENAKIAGFLHYSLQTVYNYRQRMRNKAKKRGQSLSEKVILFGK